MGSGFFVLILRYKIEGLYIEKFRRNMLQYEGQYLAIFR